MTSFKATMKVESISGDENATAREVRLSTVTTDNPKDNTASTGTPHGSATIRLEGEHINDFEQGDTISVTFTKRKKKDEEEDK